MQLYLATLSSSINRARNVQCRSVSMDANTARAAEVSVSSCRQATPKKLCATRRDFPIRRRSSCKAQIDFNEAQNSPSDRGIIWQITQSVRKKLPLASQPRPLNCSLNE